jgi:putative flippase GtrA
MRAFRGMERALTWYPLGAQYFPESKVKPLKELPRFLFVGVINTVVGLSAIFFAKLVLSMGDVAANALGYAIGLLVSFLLNRRWTFQHTGSVTRSLPLFLLVQGVAYSANLICVLSLIHFGIDGYFAQVCGIPPYTALSFLGSRYFAFRAHAVQTRH